MIYPVCSPTFRKATMKCRERIVLPARVAILLLLLTNFWQESHAFASIVGYDAKTLNDRSVDFSSAPASPGLGAVAERPLGEHYLLLVNTAIARLLKPADIAEFNNSPYDGLAIAFHYNYDTAPVFSSDTMTAQLLDWKKLGKKDLALGVHQPNDRRRRTHQRAHQRPVLQEN
jgi:hypothetical protein